MRVTSYFDVTNAQISFSRKPRPPQCSLASLARVPKVTPPSKNARSANDYFCYTKEPNAVCLLDGSDVLYTVQPT